MARKNVLITGLPRSGKTTAILKIAERLGGLNPVGFYTRETREKGERRGFELVSLDGRKGILSHVDIESRHRVGKYRVDVEGFDRFLESVPFGNPASLVVIIDEIGKMESFSGRFKSIVVCLLDSARPVVATIGMKGDGFMEEIRKRPDVELFFLSPENRDDMVDEIAEYVRKLKAPDSM